MLAAASGTVLAPGVWLGGARRGECIADGFAERFWCPERVWETLAAASALRNALPVSWQLSAVECALTKFASVTPVESTLTKKGGVGG